MTDMLGVVLPDSKMAWPEWLLHTLSQLVTLAWPLERFLEGREKISVCSNHKAVDGMFNLENHGQCMVPNYIGAASHSCAIYSLVVLTS
jgi:hypothetical protein